MIQIVLAIEEIPTHQPGSHLAGLSLDYQVKPSQPTELETAHAAVVVDGLGQILSQLAGHVANQPHGWVKLTNDLSGQDLEAAKQRLRQDGITPDHSRN